MVHATPLGSHGGIAVAVGSGVLVGVAVGSGVAVITTVMTYGVRVGVG